MMTKIRYDILQTSGLECLSLLAGCPWLLSHANRRGYRLLRFRSVIWRHLLSIVCFTSLLRVSRAVNLRCLLRSHPTFSPIRAIQPVLPRFI